MHFCPSVHLCSFYSRTLLTHSCAPGFSCSTSFCPKMGNSFTPLLVRTRALWVHGEPMIVRMQFRSIRIARFVPIEPNKWQTIRKNSHTLQISVTIIIHRGTLQLVVLYICSIKSILNPLSFQSISITDITNHFMKCNSMLNFVGILYLRFALGSSCFLFIFLPYEK